jgi:hypothetical protein
MPVRQNTEQHSSFSVVGSGVQVAVSKKEWNVGVRNVHLAPKKGHKFARLCGGLASSACGSEGGIQGETARSFSGFSTVTTCVTTKSLSLYLSFLICNMVIIVVSTSSDEK